MSINTESDCIVAIFAPLTSPQRGKIMIFIGFFEK